MTLRAPAAKLHAQYEINTQTQEASDCVTEVSFQKQDASPRRQTSDGQTERIKTLMGKRYTVPKDLRVVTN